MYIKRSERRITTPNMDSNYWTDCTGIRCTYF